jgi:hypothetical protein
VEVTVKTPGDAVKCAELKKKFDAMFAAAGTAGTPPVFVP